jgi:Na+:H+ antiporter
MLDLSYLAIIWVGAFAASIVAFRTRLTPVLWYLFFGSLFVNIGWLPQHMPGFIEGFAEVGIILIMFALGFEEDTTSFVRSIKRSWGIAFFGALVPFCVAYSVIHYFWGDSNMALLGGLSMTATAVSLTMVSLKTEGLHRTEAATGIMTSAVLDDIASLALVAIMVPVAAGEAPVSAAGIALVLGKTMLFFFFVIALGWLLSANASPLHRLPLLGRFNLRLLLGLADGEQATLGILIIAILVSLVAYYFGFHPAVGAYMAGLILKEEYFIFHQDKGIDFHKNVHAVIDNAAFSWIGPVFFVVLGTKLIFDVEIFISVLPQTILLTLGLFTGQILSAGLAARFTGKFDWPSSWMIGFGMLGRAELALVVIDIAYVQHQIFTDEVFYTLMFTAFWLNVSVPISIRWWKYRYGHTVSNLAT